MLFMNAIVYALHYSPVIQALSLIGGAVLGQGMAAWADLEINNSKLNIKNRFCVWVVSFLIILLALTSVWKGDSGHFSEYYGSPRWLGPWNNPNIFGLFMGTGITLAAGMGMRKWKIEEGGAKMIDMGWKSQVWKYFCALLCFFAAFLMARGLLHSYSRGAWIATFCGLCYLFWSYATHLTPTLTPRRAGGEGESLSCNSCVSCLKKNRPFLFMVLISAILLVFWHFRQTEWRPARRAFSSVKLIDFSWRNRIAALEGALQITAENPWFGVGWNQPKPLYEHYYLPPKLAEGGAIGMNDYLMLGATLGIPTLFCFGMYLWLSLTRKSAVGGRQDGYPVLEIGHWTLDWPKTACRAGVIVLIVGFWFDGGLFKLATASTFWILLGLGSIRNHETDEAHEK
jgi:O-antigen ligase